VTLLVLHLLPLDLARGAQRYVKALQVVADGQPHRHQILTLFESGVDVVDADVRLDLPRQTAARLGFDPRVANRLRAALATVDPDVVVAHGSEPLKYAVAARWAGPLVYYKIGKASLDRAPVRRAMHRALLRAPDLVVGVSDDCRREAEEQFGVPASRLRVIPNARDPQVFRPSNRLGDGEAVELVFVGHLTGTKRPQEFAATVRRLRARGLPVRGTLVGDGPLLEPLRREAEDSGIDVLGRRSDVPDLLRAADLLLFTSVPTGEGMPGVLIEAGMSGLPVIATDVPGARDVIEHGVTGFVIPPAQIDSAEELAARLVEQHEVRARMGRAARERCERLFSIDASAASWTKLLESVVGSHS
jgi:glycosyltransferase involved in cell wall biosynthesis